MTNQVKIHIFNDNIALWFSSSNKTTYISPDLAQDLVNELSKAIDSFKTGKDYPSTYINNGGTNND